MGRAFSTICCVDRTRPCRGDGYKIFDTLYWCASHWTSHVVTNCDVIKTQRLELLHIFTAQCTCKGTPIQIVAAHGQIHVLPPKLMIVTRSDWHCCGCTHNHTFPPRLQKEESPGRSPDGRLRGPREGVGGCFKAMQMH